MSASREAFSLGNVGGQGPALLCLHGLTGVPRDVRPPAKVHEQMEIACLGPLLPGHGTSPAELARTTHEQWLSAALDHYDRLARTHERVYVLGFSMGGVLALRLCSLRSVPGLLVLAAPIDLGRVRRTLARSFAPFLSAIPRIPGVVDRAARARDAGYRRMPLRAVVQLMELQRIVARLLPELRAPLRLLYSRRDATVDVLDAERIARAVSSTDVQVEYLDRSGHMLMLDLEHERVANWIAEQLRTWEASHLRG